MTKKSIIKICSLLIWSCFLFASCEKNETLLDSSLYDEAFRAKNDMLFLNEACDHTMVYVSSSELSKSADPNVYHTEKCKWSDCDFEAVLEAHTLWIRSDSNYITTGITKYMENGYFYHRAAMSCTKCHQQITLYVYCYSQEKDCHKITENNPCFTRDWEDILCDTPYGISFD